MVSVNLSYIITTCNRLPYLRILLERLISQVLADEEIVVVDADSTDGSKEYLQQLFDAGVIHQFISEPDRNQAHGWNKALLMARGTLIKKLIDDDVYSFEAIGKCKAFMLENSMVDVCISNTLAADLTKPGQINATGRLTQFKQWQRGETGCFTFSDVYMLIRKSALSYIGLYDTQFAMIDWEYSLRCSFLKAGIAYYTGYNTLTVDTPGNITSSTSAETLQREAQIGKQKYGYPGDRASISLYSELKIAVGKAINYKSTKHAQHITTPHNQATFANIAEAYQHFYSYLEQYNKGQEFEFLFSETTDKN